MGNAAMFDNKKQRVDLHEYMLLKHKDILGLKLHQGKISTNNIAAARIPNLDIELHGTDSEKKNIPVLRPIECKTEGIKNIKNLLCLELATNLPDLPYILQQINPDWENPTTEIHNIVVPAQTLNGYIVRAREITTPKEIGYVYAKLPANHLLSHWHQGLGIYSIWYSAELVKFCLKHEYEWAVTFGPNRNDDGSCWYSICILIPQELAMQSGALLFAQNNISPQEYTEAYVAPLLAQLKALRDS